MNFSDVMNEKYLYLTTKGRRTGQPHTVELWFAVMGKNVYLSHEGESTDWMKNIQEDKCVHFKVGGSDFVGEAQIVSRGKAFEVGKRALYLKYYGKASDETIDDWFSGSTIIEIKTDEKKSTMLSPE